MHWQLVIEDRVSDSYGLAADETMARRVGHSESNPTLRLYTYRNYSALVGRFQNTENELHLDFCRENDVAINRRPTGGGAIIMGEEQLGIALTIPGRSEDTYGRARELMERFAAAVTNGLCAFGISSSFRHKNDLEVNGRKIAGLGIHRDVSGGLLFHASLLVDMNISLMLKVLNTPFEKISDKEIRTVADRIETIRHFTGRQFSVAEVREEMSKAFARTYDVTLHRDAFTAEEVADIARLETEKYQTANWIHQLVSVPDTVGSAKVKTPGGDRKSVV